MAHSENPHLTRILLLAALLASACSPSGSRLVGTTDSSYPGFDGGTIPDAGPPSDEICGDGLDNNGDGLIEEGCTCADGERQACWPGPVSRRRIGACRDGVQVCEPYGEFLAWGPCRNAVLPNPEIEGNGIDEDCDGSDPGRPECLANEFGESCGGGFDDDCDGLVDCDDPDCAGGDLCSGSCTPAEFGELCDDGIDNDCDALVDCLDPECADATPCRRDMPDPGCRAEFPFFVEIACGDRRDNDCDGRIDCDDSDCRRPGSCGCDPREDACSDGMDNDCDGSSDCADLDCQRCTPGTYRWCDETEYCHWGKQECGSDGRWGACVETDDRPMGCTSTLYSTSCCIDAGECCQNYPHDDTSVGMCSTIVTCR